MQTIRNPLKCHPDPDYVSEQQWLVNDFFDKDFSPCPVKCIPLQMRGYRYVNSSSDLKNCNKLDDEVIQWNRSETIRRAKQDVLRA